MEQLDVSAGPSAVAIGSLRASLSDEARASLDAVRSAQEIARRRARQQTRRARLWLLTIVGTVALAAVFGPRFARGGHRQEPARPTTTAALSAPVAVQPAPIAAPAAAAPELPPVTRPNVQDSAGATGGCDPDAIRTSPWRASPEACTRAFEANPTNPSFALAVAQAEHARGRLTEAAQWANRALALDPNAAEAYVIVARAETHEGRHPQARLAYRHYLELAPRGWHRAEARAALRRAGDDAR
jgi:tetratricopeptide (TPR) repeat protein